MAIFVELRNMYINWLIYCLKIHVRVIQFWNPNITIFIKFWYVYFLYQDLVFGESKYRPRIDHKILIRLSEINTIDINLKVTTIKKKRFDIRFFFEAWTMSFS